MSDGQLIVSNLSQLTKAFKAAEGDLDKRLRRELKAIGGVVQAQAKQNAAAQGLRDSGALINGIEVGFSRGSVSIYETASRRSVVGATAYTKSAKASRMGLVGDRRSGRGLVDYPYPVVYEFGGRGTGQLGPKAFMYPALEQKQQTVMSMFEQLLDRVGSEWSTA